MAREKPIHQPDFTNPYAWQFGLESLDPAVSSLPFVGYDPHNNFFGVKFNSIAEKRNIPFLDIFNFYYRCCH